ncbi:DUF945 family protein [Candidiatus Paracoxiella cheracis]|uniref:DUF945 family protein n=1 Tax=Candidiatus Paracoxiella cheracis TaxID=3405120 RepID=UPI003BF5A890
MRKLFGFIIGIIVIAAVIIFLILPLSMGFWVKSHYQQLLDKVNKAPGIALKVVQFDRGWFTSKATLQVTIKPHWPRFNATTNSAPIQFTVRQRIKNGPWIFGAQKFLWAKALVQSTSDAANFKFNAQTIIHFSNAIDNSFFAKSITIANSQGQVVINNLNSHIIYAPSTQQLTRKTSIGSLTITEKESEVASPQAYKQKFEIINLNSSSQLKRLNLLWYGDRSISADKATFFIAQKEPFVLSQVTLAAKQSQTNGTSANIFKAHADSIVGDGVDLKPFDLKLSIVDVDAQSLMNLLSAAMQLSQSTQSDMLQIKTLYIPFAQLVSKGFTAKLHYLTFGTPEGIVNATAQLILPKQSGAPSALLLLQNATGELHMQMPLTWLKQFVVNLYRGNTDNTGSKTLSPEKTAQQQIQMWIDNKKLIQDGQNVKIDVTFKNGQLLINGLPPSYQAPAQTPTQQQPSTGTTPAPQQ